MGNGWIRVSRLTQFQVPHGGGGGGADSALLQIVFFINSVRDAAEPQNLVIHKGDSLTLSYFIF